MVELLAAKPIECDDLGDRITLEVTPYYLKVIVDKRTYYFEREMGKFDGTSYQLSD